MEGIMVEAKLWVLFNFEGGICDYTLRNHSPCVRIF